MFVQRLRYVECFKIYQRIPRFPIVEAFWSWSVHLKFLQDFSVNKCHADVQKLPPTHPTPQRLPKHTLIWYNKQTGLMGDVSISHEFYSLRFQPVPSNNVDSLIHRHFRPSICQNRWQLMACVAKLRNIDLSCRSPSDVAVVRPLNTVGIIWKWKYFMW